MSKYGHRGTAWLESIVDKLGGEEAAEAFLRDQNWEILRPISAVIVNFTPRLNETASSFFATREGLEANSLKRLDDDLLDHPLLSIRQTLTYHVLMKKTLMGVEVNKPPTDSDIIAEFNSNKTPFIFESPIVFLSIVAGLLLEQWGGKPGTLLNNGYSNIFYVKVNNEVIVFTIKWHTDRQTWEIYRQMSQCYQRWHTTGHRVFRRKLLHSIHLPSGI